MSDSEYIPHPDDTIPPLRTPAEYAEAKKHLAAEEARVAAWEATVATMTPEEFEAYLREGEEPLAWGA